MINLIESKKALIEYLDEIGRAHGHPLSAKCKDFLFQHIKHISLKRGEYLLTPRKVCKNLYFIQEGLLGDFYGKGKEKIYDWFFGKGQTVVAIDSFYDQVPSTDWIEALQHCELLYITYEELEHLYRTCVEFNVVGRVLTNKYLRVWHRQARNLRRLKSPERYLLMSKTEPELTQLVPQKALASFLDMTEHTLSRMLSKRASPNKRTKPKPTLKISVKK